MKRAIRIFFISIIILVTLTITTGFIIGYFYGDKITQYVVSQLNNYIDTEISIGKVEFSIFKKFPNASIEFTDVAARSTKKFHQKDFKKTNAKTLFIAQKVFLQFNVIDIFKKHYKIKKISIEGCTANLLIDNDGNDNFHFLKNTENSDTSKVTLNLNSITLKETNVYFENRYKRITVSAYTSKFVLNGNFSSDSYEMKTSGKLKVDKFMLDDVNYLNTHKVDVAIKLDVNNDNYSIKSGSLTIDDFVLDIYGKIAISSPSKINMVIKGKDLSIRSFLSLLPEKYKNYTSDYESSGRFFFESKISGFVDNVKSPHIDVDFGITNAIITNSKSDVKLTDVVLNGTFSNGKLNRIETSYLQLKNFKTNFGGSTINGSYTIENFSNPRVRLNANANINLSELISFLKIDTIKSISGKMISNIQFEGTMQNLATLTAEDFKNSKTEGNVKIENATIKFQNQANEYTNVNGQFAFNNNNLKMDNLSFNLGENDFKINGNLKNLLSYCLIDNQPLLIEANIYSKNIKIENNNDDSSNKNKIGLPEKVMLVANIEIENLKMPKFTASDIEGDMVFHDNNFVVNSFSLNVLGGNIRGGGKIALDPNKKIDLQCAVTLEKMNIKKVFNVFNDFGQDFIKERHINGTLSADVRFSTQLTSNFEIIPQTLVAESSVEITNGELINFEPLNELSTFVELSELKHIKFSKLKNNVLIKNQTIIIPQMEVNSSAISLSIAGEHKFDNHINYKVKVRLSEILSRKAKTAKKENEEFGVVEDDGLGSKTSIYLSITGTTDDYKIAYDTRQVKQNIKQNYQEEKKELKKMLNEEFGWFKKDTTINKDQPKINDKVKKPPVIIKWDENAPEEKDLSE